MRIVIIAEVFLPKIDGVVGRTLNLIRELQALGDEILVVCPEVAEPRNSPVRLLEFPGFPCPSYPEYVIGRPDSRLIQQLTEFRPDVIHFLNPFAFGFQCCDLLQGAGFRVPTLFSFHTLYGEFAKQYRGLRSLSGLLWWLMRQYHNTADINLTVSSIAADQLRQLGFQRVELWPPAVNSTLFHPGQRCLQMRNRMSGDRSAAPLLLTVSRLAPEKNVRFLAEVLKRNPEASLAVVGDGPQRAELEKLFEGTRTRFIGYLHGQELAQAYASADAFVYASETETMGNVILEAMASGLPVIAADAGGVPGLIRHEVDGLLFKTGDANQAAGYVRQVLGNSELRSRMSEAAVGAVTVQTWQNAAFKVRDYYRQVIDQADTSVDRKQRPGPRTGLKARFCTGALIRMMRITAIG